MSPPLGFLNFARYFVRGLVFRSSSTEYAREFFWSFVTFDSGSWEVAPEQQARLAVVADAIRRVLAEHPDEVFMIEGHTDAVGSDVDNLSLSDRRAEAVAVILTDAYQIPPENLVTQGYGEQHPKLPVAGPSRENRRVAVRRVTPLLNGTVAAQQ